MHPSEVYARHLLSRAKSYPLWMPEPLNHLCEEYKQHGVRVGDVGTVTRGGGFDFIFNVCESEDHPINHRGVPEGFEQVFLAAADIAEDNLYQSSAHVSSVDMKKRVLKGEIPPPDDQQKPLEVNVTFEVKTTSKTGAVLLLPDGATTHDLLPRKIFRQYALKHAPSWYKFVNGTLGREVSNGALYLVTGMDKTTSWGVASFSNVVSRHDVVLALSATYENTLGTLVCTWEWDQRGPADGRSWPRSLPPAPPSAKNHAVFIRGFKVAIRPNQLVKRIVGEVEVTDVEKSKPQDMFRSTGTSLIPYANYNATPHQSSKCDGKSPSEVQDADIEIFVEDIIPESEPYHPASVLSNYIFDTIPRAEIVAVHDDEWAELVEQHTEFPDDQELVKRFQDKFSVDVDQETGTATLSHKSESFMTIANPADSADNVPISSIPSAINDHISITLPTPTPLQDEDITPDNRSCPLPLDGSRSGDTPLETGLHSQSASHTVIAISPYESQSKTTPHDSNIEAISRSSSHSSARIHPRLRPRHPTSSHTSSPSLFPSPDSQVLIRTAISMLCKEIMHLTGHSETSIRDWDEVEARMRPLTRLERVLGISSNVRSSSEMVSATPSASGRERERRLFYEALRDGFVLCHLMNKFHSNQIIRPNPKEDGILRTSNITKFLAACVAYGLSSDDLFHQDDLIEGSAESLIRVAKTIIVLINFSRSSLKKASQNQYETPLVTSVSGTSGEKDSLTDVSSPNIPALSTHLSPRVTSRTVNRRVSNSDDEDGSSIFSSSMADSIFDGPRSSISTTVTDVTSRSRWSSRSSNQLSSGAKVLRLSSHGLRSYEEYRSGRFARLSIPEASSKKLERKDQIMTKPPAIRLVKGKWPEDFLDVVQACKNTSTSTHSSVVQYKPRPRSSSSFVEKSTDPKVDTGRKIIILQEEGKPTVHFQLGNSIGCGQISYVYRALNLNTGEIVAVKHILPKTINDELVPRLIKEVNLLKRLSHSGLIKYEGVIHNEDKVHIIQEYAENGSLLQVLDAFGKLNERLVASYVMKILEALQYLHENDVVHLNLKAGNVLTTKNGQIKLTDFGLSFYVSMMDLDVHSTLAPNWMAPEVIELKGAAPKSDIWSLACTVIELLTGQPPYTNIANTMSVMFHIVEDDHPPMPDGCSDMLNDFLIQCFNKDPGQRPSAEHLLRHPWLNRLQVSERRSGAELAKVRRISKAENDSAPSTSQSTKEGKLARQHAFIRTTFHKPVICRVCQKSTNRHAVICENCSLVAHAKCATNAPHICDIRSQLPLGFLSASMPGNNSAGADFKSAGSDTHVDADTANNEEAVSGVRQPPIDSNTEQPSTQTNPPSPSTISSSSTSRLMTTLKRWRLGLTLKSDKSDQKD